MSPCATSSSRFRRCGKLALCLAALACRGQQFEHRGFVEAIFTGYPQEAANDSGRAIGAWLLRYEPAYNAGRGLRFAASLDVRTDTHRQVERSLRLSWLDRERRRPAFAVRRLSAIYNRGRLRVEAGRQLIRWGKTDILNPTDRFAPRDYLNVVDWDFLGIAAARLTYGGQPDTLDLVWAPLFTPSRVPLLNQRWAPAPAGVVLRDSGASHPGGSQFGARWNHVGRTVEYALAFYEGFNNLPLFRSPALSRYYPQMRMYGGDAALPLRAVSIKAEAAYFTSSDPTADEYALYVVQLERQTGEWFLVGGYAGQVVTGRRAFLDFAPDRGLARAFVGRAGYTIDTNRSVAVETAVRQNGKGIWAKLEYTQAFGQHWRATAGLALMRGSESDFLGRYRRNSHGILAVRYSF
ncbi:MAG: hypothetical protein ACE15B_16090 [Bryobacteraceae bacterium]